MALRLKKIIIGNIIIIFLVLFLLVFVFDKYEFSINVFTMWDLQVYLWRINTILISFLAVWWLLERKYKLIKKIIIFLVISILFLYSFALPATLTGTACRRSQFYELDIEGDVYEQTIAVQEWDSFRSTSGMFYIRLNPILLREIEGSLYHTDPGYYPVGLDEYRAEYHAEEKTLYFWYKTFNEEDDMSSVFFVNLP